MKNNFINSIAAILRAIIGMFTSIFRWFLPDSAPKQTQQGVATSSTSGAEKRGAADRISAAAEQLERDVKKSRRAHFSGSHIVIESIAVSPRADVASIIMRDITGVEHKWQPRLDPTTAGIDFNSTPPALRAALSAIPREELDKVALVLQLEVTKQVAGIRANVRHKSRNMLDDAFSAHDVGVVSIQRSLKNV